MVWWWSFDVRFWIGTRKQGQSVYFDVIWYPYSEKKVSRLIFLFNDIIGGLIKQIKKSRFTDLMKAINTISDSSFVPSVFPWTKRRLYKILQKGSIYYVSEVSHLKTNCFKLLLQSNIYMITHEPMGITIDLKREPKCLPRWISWNLSKNGHNSPQNKCMYIAWNEAHFFQPLQFFCVVNIIVMTLNRVILYCKTQLKILQNYNYWYIIVMFIVLPS